MFLLLMFAVTGCVPYFSLLAAYDEVAELRKAGIVLLLDGQEQEADRYARYGYTRKAARMRRRDAKLSDAVEAARYEFSFCDLRVQWQEQGGIPPDAYRMRIVPAPLMVGNSEREAYALQLRDPSGNPLPGGFPDTEMIGEMVSVGGLRLAFKAFNRQLLQLERRAIRAQERAALKSR